MAITGANAQTYTLTPADVGSTIRVQESASNASGAGVPATSRQTALVTAMGPGPSPGPRPAPTDKTAPRLTGYGLTNNPFVVGGGSTPTLGSAAKAKKHQKGTTLRYTLSETATVKIVIARGHSGRRQGKRCVTPTRKLRKAKKCTRLFKNGTLTRTSHQGANKVAFSGRIGSKALKPGRYQTTLTATDKAKNTSKPKTISFTVVKR